MLIKLSLTIVKESTIWGKKLLMSSTNSKWFGVNFSPKLYLPSHGLGGEDLGWYGRIVHFLRVRQNILVGTATGKLILILARCVLARCLSTTPKTSINKSNNKRIERTQETLPLLLCLLMGPQTTITTLPLMDGPSKKACKLTLDYIKPLKKFLVFASGAAICKTAFTTLIDIEQKIEVEYCQRIEKLLFYNIDNIEQFGPPPVEFSPVQTWPWPI